MNDQLLVTKASGERHPFSEQKLLASLRRAGADTDQAEKILEEVKLCLYEGITTRKIYRIAFALLKTASRHVAARYHLKHALMELGPSGYPFERYIGELLQFEGYRTETAQMLEGKCVTHEIDIIARNARKLLLTECKYHNYQGISCDVKIPLYVHARFLDLTTHGKVAGHETQESECWIVTNTRFTDDALKYAACTGLHLLAWDFPSGNGLKDRIDKLGLYPVTCLTSLTKAEKQLLLGRGVVLCGEIEDNGMLLKSLGIKPARAMVVLNEVDQLCDTSVNGIVAVSSRVPGRRKASLTAK